jgi:hypothetical protein
LFQFVTAELSFRVTFLCTVRAKPSSIGARASNAHKTNGLTAIWNAPTVLETNLTVGESRHPFVTVPKSRRFMVSRDAGVALA